MTQEDLAESSGLSADTIRRVEQGSFSPSLDTITKLCEGMSISRGTLFTGYELGERDVSRELSDAISLLSDSERHIILKMIQALKGASEIWAIE
jgi:transcriptional regulator with XRE-family HTH domain